MLYQKGEEIMGFTAVTEPKTFGRCQTIIWKKGKSKEKGYFVTVHELDEKGTLRSVKWKGTCEETVDLLKFAELVSFFKSVHPEEMDTALDTTVSDEVFNQLWLRAMSYRQTGFENTYSELVWTPEGTKFLVTMLLDEMYRTGIYANLLA